MPQFPRSMALIAALLGCSLRPVTAAELRMTMRMWYSKWLFSGPEKVITAQGSLHLQGLQVVAFNYIGNRPYGVRPSDWKAEDKALQYGFEVPYLKLVMDWEGEGKATLLFHLAGQGPDSKATGQFRLNVEVRPADAGGTARGSATLDLEPDLAALAEAWKIVPLDLKSLPEREQNNVRPDDALFRLVDRDVMVGGESKGSAASTPSP